MLVLSRHVGEQIVIGGGVTVTVVQISGSQVRLGVNAPKSVRVDRNEIHQRRLADGGCNRRTPLRLGVPSVS